jgi:hypothetical protein
MQPQAAGVAEPIPALGGSRESDPDVVSQSISVTLSPAQAYQSTGHGSESFGAATIWRLAVWLLALVRPSTKSTRLFSRGPLWESDRGADKVAFGKLYAAMTQNIVSGGVMKIEVG